MKISIKKACYKCLLTIPLLTGAYAMETDNSKEPENNSSPRSWSFSNFFSFTNYSTNYSHDLVEETSLRSFQFAGLDKVVKQAMIPMEGEPNFWPQDWGTPITITCLDNVNLSGHWIQGGKNPLGPTVILFHGNGMTSDSYEPWARCFQEYGYNVLAATIRGYPGSEGSSDLIKKSSALDVEGIIRYATQELKIPKSNLALYGFSLGGPYATYGARYFQIPVILQNTLTSVPDIIQNVSPIPLPSCTRNAIARSHMDKGNTMPIFEYNGLFEEKGSVPINSFNNLDNLQATTTPVMVIYAQNDTLMGKEDRAKELYQARYGKETQINPDLFVEIPNGSHVSVFLRDENAKNAVFNFLKTIFK